MLRAETTAARFRIEAAAAGRGVEGWSLETEELSARANFWKAPKRGSPWWAPVRMTAMLSPGLKTVVEGGTDSMMPAKEVPRIDG